MTATEGTTVVLRSTTISNSTCTTGTEQASGLQSCVSCIFVFESLSDASRCVVCPVSCVVSPRLQCSDGGGVGIFDYGDSSNGTELLIENCDILGNDAGQQGRCLSWSLPPSLPPSATPSVTTVVSSIDQCTPVLTAGGGVFFHVYASTVGAATFTMRDTRVLHNTAQEGDGAGVVVWLPEDTPVKHPECEQREYRQWLRQRSVSIVDCDVSYNEAMGDGRGGGGIVVQGGGDVVIERSSIHNNWASGSGGGVMIQEVSVFLRLVESNVANNSAATGAQLHLFAGGGVEFRNITMALGTGPSQVRSS
jgi:hypothetical protein